MGTIHQFWFEVRSHWDPGDEDELQAVAGAVLRHLRMQLPVTETDHLFRDLPEELDRMTREVRPFRKYPGRQRGERDSEPDFYSHVSEETGLPPEQTAEATRAVFAALKHHLPAAEVNHVHSMLPSGLKRQWELAW